MRRFVLPEGFREGEPIRIQGSGYRYLVRVLRLAPGDSFPATDGRGKAVRLRILEVSDGACVAAASEPAADAAARGDAAEITLLACLPKGRRMDDIVRQATQAGVARIVPVESERTVPRGDEDGPTRAARWQRVAREALQQSGAAALPRIDPPTRLAEAAAEGAWDAAIFFHEERIGAGSIHDAVAGKPRRLALLVGPEGGFSGAEVRLLRERGFTPVWLGDTVLRVETACIYALGAVRTILQERDAWKPSR